jgi:hypothetical protein
MTFLTTFRVIHLIIQSTCLTLVLIINHKFPLPSDARIKQLALDRGFHSFTIFLTRAIQHYTICSAVLLIFTLSQILLYENSLWFVPYLASITHGIQTSVGILYHSFIWHDPFHLFPRLNFPKEPDRVVKMLTSWIPPVKEKVSTQVLWLVLHIQHTFAPLHMWIEVYLRAPWTKRIDFAIEMEIAIVSGLLVVYMLWNTYCWYVRGEPAYPIQHKMLSKGVQHSVWFYMYCFVVVLLCTYASRWYRDNVHHLHSEDA